MCSAVLRHGNQHSDQFNSIIRPGRPVSEVLTQAMPCHAMQYDYRCTGTLLLVLLVVVELYLTTGYGIAINGYNSPPSGPGAETGSERCLVV